MNRNELQQFIKEQALLLGFEACGFSSAEPLVSFREDYLSYLRNKYHGTMMYMERNIDKRLDPTLLVDGAKTIISVLYNYYTPDIEADRKYKVSMYARGIDYHYILKEKLEKLAEIITTNNGSFTYRIFVDSAPVMDKVWAWKGGLGWIGKNSCLIHPSGGSYFFIGEIVCDLELPADAPVEERCGTCTRCIDACPTKAITAPGKIDASRCISYLTIEHKGDIDPELKEHFHDYIFGCDICQTVCPWNRFAKPHKEQHFNTLDQVKAIEDNGLDAVSSSLFKKALRSSPLARAGVKKMRRNIQYINGTIQE